MDQNQMPMQGTPKKSVGPIIGIVIIIVVLVIGALYFWGARLNKTAPVDPLENSETSTVPESLEDISSDLNATVIGSADADLENIEKELDAE